MDRLATVPWSMVTVCLVLLVQTALGSSRGDGPHGGVWKRGVTEVEFTENVENKTVVVGRNATLRCSVRNIGIYRIAWIKSDTQTLLSVANTMITRNYRVRVSNSDNNTWFLHISNVRLADRGYYMCQVNTSPMVSREGYLEIVVPPNILDEDTSTDLEVSEDAQASLRCAAEGHPPPEITFKREDNRPIRFGKSAVSGPRAFNETKLVDGVSRTTGQLVFESVSRADMGKYLCIATNAVPPSVSKRIVLNVRYREPDVHVSHQMIGVYRGDDVDINCTVTAYPRPVVLWQDHRGKMIITGGRFEVKETLLGESPPVIQTTLRIRRLRPTDIGKYMCNASIDNDKERMKSLTVQLNEISPPPTETPLSPDINYKAPRQQLHPKKSLSKQSRVNDIPERYEKPTSFVPGNNQETYLHPSLGHANYDDSSSSSSASQSQHTIRLFLILIGLLM